MKFGRKIQKKEKKNPEKKIFRKRKFDEKEFYSL